MTANPALGVALHWIGGLAGAAFMVWGREATQPAMVAVSAGIALLLVVLQLGGIAAAMQAGRKQGPPGRP